MIETMQLVSSTGFRIVATIDRFHYPVSTVTAFGYPSFHTLVTFHYKTNSSTQSKMWRPTLGGQLLDDGRAYFRVWAPGKSLNLVLASPHSGQIMAKIPMKHDGDGYFVTELAHAEEGLLYAFEIGDFHGRNFSRLLPDPCSRYQRQDQGVHGFSSLQRFAPARQDDDPWIGMKMVDVSAGAIYELHIGCFTPEGTFRAAAEKLGHLKELGITVIELMPLNEFAGDRGWGYDGVLFSSVHSHYGTRRELADFIREAHLLEMAVILDVVYNHAGPSGNYLGHYTERYFDERNKTPWGPSFNFSNEHVRRFFLENARLWIHEFDFDGLRLDAAHYILDKTSRKHFLQELNETLAADCQAIGRLPPLMIAEDYETGHRLLKPISDGGYELTGVWHDELHHNLHVRLTGEKIFHFTGSTADIAKTIRDGWPYVPYFSFVNCIQNHDQVGNLPYGSRINHIPFVSMAAYRAAISTLLFLPHTPLLFMGEEWNASSPFHYFTNHDEILGRGVDAGRRRGFDHRPEMKDRDIAATVPNPQVLSTFTDSKLRWNETADGSHPIHAQTLLMYARLLELRGKYPRYPYPELRAKEINSLLVVGRIVADGSRGFVLVANFEHHGEHGAHLHDFLRDDCHLRHFSGRGEAIYSTDTFGFADQVSAAPAGSSAAHAAGARPAVSFDRHHQLVTFSKPGAIILEYN